MRRLNKVIFPFLIMLMCIGVMAQDSQSDTAAEGTSETQADGSDSTSSNSEASGGGDSTAGSSEASAGEKPSSEQSNSVQSGSPAKEKSAIKRKKSKTKTETFTPELIWDSPEIKSTKKKRVKEVTLNGATEKGIKVGLRSKVIWITTNKAGKQKVRQLKTRILRVKGKKYVELNPDGSFKINLKLPEGEVQVPVTLKKGNLRANYSLALIIKDKEIELKDESLLKNDCKYCIWLGTGVNYLAYQQDPPQKIAEVDYGAFGAPTIMLRGRFQVAKNWRIRAAYNSIGGPEISSPNVTIQSKKINWTHFSLEADYRAIKPFRLFGAKFAPALLGGVQVHDMPFLVPVDVDNDLFTIDSFKFNSLSGGGMFFVNSHKRLYYEIYMRVQMALAGSGDVKLKSGFAFDGSVGMIYRLTKNVSLGGFWGGQYHSYQYELEGAEGSYTLLSSKMDLNIGYEF